MEIKKIKKLVIPVAGIGTRMLPVTKAQPKEMMPVLDKPVIQYIVEDAVKAGITDIIFVTGPTKKAIEDHFDRIETLEDICIKGGKDWACKAIKDVAELANFIYIRQRGPYGNGTPVLNAKDLIGDEPFAVVWGDEIFDCPDGKPHLRQLMDVFEKYGESVVTAVPIDDEGTKKYGVIEGNDLGDGIMEVNRLIEKPGPEGTKSRIAAIGGYILTPDIFDILQNLKIEPGKELCLPDAIDILSQRKKVYAKHLDGTPNDTGSKLGWLKTNIKFGLRDPEIGDQLRKYLNELL
ncbi:MAG: UTP--glucose-1-phosphate uridylyltransferase [Candidatus Buchananbacteria bacterium]